MATDKKAAPRPTRWATIALYGRDEGWVGEWAIITAVGPRLGKSRTLDVATAAAPATSITTADATADQATSRGDRSGLMCMFRLRSERQPVAAALVRVQVDVRATAAVQMPE